MKIISPPSYLILPDGAKLMFKHYNIGAWNMDTTGQVTISITEDITKIESVYVMVTDDAISQRISLRHIHSDGVGQGTYQLVPNNINLFRTAAGIFDNVAFSSILISRGKIQIGYIA